MQKEKFPPWEQYQKDHINNCEKIPWNKLGTILMINFLGCFFLMRTSGKPIILKSTKRTGRLLTFTEWDFFMREALRCPPKPLNKKERAFAEKAAKLFTENPWYGLTKKEKEMLTKRAEEVKQKRLALVARWDFAKKNYGTNYDLTITLIMLGCLYTNQQEEILVKLVNFYEDNIKGKRKSKRLTKAIEDFLEKINSEVEADAEAEHMASF